MGKSSSKLRPRDELRCKDWKLINDQNPKKLAKLDKWITDYGFKGQLNSQQIIDLQDKIKQRTKYNPKKMKKCGYEDTEFWLQIALKREKGQRDLKINTAERDDKQLMFHRKEDDDTVNRYTRRRAEQAAAQAAQGGEAGVEQREAEEKRVLYPDLSELHAPPPEYTTPIDTTKAYSNTRSTNPFGYAWSKTLGQTLTPAPKINNPSGASALTTEDMYPMIEVANPNVEGDQPTMLIYRTWTMDDVKKALEGVPSHKEDIDLFIESMENVRKAYHLNGAEVQQIWMTALGSNWSHVRGDWNPKLDDAVLKPNDGELTNRVNALAQRARRTSHAAKWADLIADPKGYDWQSWTTNPTAKHQRKLLKIDYDNSKFVLTADLTGNNTLNPPGSSRSNTCWILLFWAWTRGADVGFPVWLCQLPPQLTNGGEKIEPKLSHVANGKGITATTSKLDADDWFLAYTGISKDINNWLLMAEQAANMTKTDCVVCLGPRPILRVTPSPVSVNCTLELMTKTNPTSSCEQWDRAFPLTTAEKMKPLFSKEIAPANFTCVNFIGGSERLGNLSSTFCADLVTLKQAHTVVSRSDIWWWCGDERLFDTFSKEATGLCALVDLERNAQLQLLLADFVSSSGCRVSIQCRHIQSPHMLTWRGTHSYSCYWLTLCHRQGVVFPFSIDIYNHRTCERVWRYGIYKNPVDLERNAQLQLLLADFVSSSGCRVSIQYRHIQSPHMLTWRGTHSYSCYWLTLCHRQGVVFPFSIDIYNHRTCERVWRYGIYKNPVDLERNAQLQLLLADFVSSSGCRVSIQCRHIQSPHMLTWRGTHSYSCYWLTLCHRQGVVFPFSIDIYNHRTCERVWRYGIYKNPVDLERHAQLQLLLADFVSSSGCRVSIQYRHIQSPHMLTWRGTHSYSCYWLTLCHRQGVVFPFSIDIYNHRTCERVWRYGIYKNPVDLERNAQLQLLLADFVSSSGCRVSIQYRHIQSPHMLTWRGTHSYSCYWLTLCHRQGVVFPFSMDIYNHRTCERVWRYGIYKNPVDLERNAQLQLLLADFVSSSGCRVSIQYRHIQSPHMLTWRGTHSYSCYWLTLCHRQGVVFPFSVDIYNHRTCERVWRYGIYKYPVDLERNAQLQLLLADFVSSSGCRVSIQCRHIQSPHMLTWRGTHSYSCYWLTLCHRQGVVFPFSVDIYNHRTCERVWRYGIYKNPVDLERNAQLQLLLADFVSSSGCRVSIQCRHIQSPHMLTWRGTHSYSCYWLTLCHRQGVVFPFSVDIYNHRTCERVWRYGIYKYPVDLERNAQLQLLLADFVSSSGCRVSIQYRHIQSPHMLTWRGTHSYSCYWLTLCHRQGVVFPFSVDIYNHRTCERVWRYGIYKYPVDLERNAQLQLLLADFVSSSGCRVSIQYRHIQSPHMLTWRGTHSYSCYWLTLCHRQGVVFPFSVDIYNHRTCERVWRYGIYKYPVDLERNAQLQLLLADFVSSSGCRVSIQYRHIQSPHMLTWRGTHSYSCYWLTLCHRQGVVFPFSIDIYNHRTCGRVWRYGIYKYPVDLERNAQLQLLLADFVSSSGCRVSIQYRHIQSPHMLTWRGTHSYSCYWLTLCHRQGVVFPFSIDIYNHRTCERVWRYGIYKNPVDLERNAQLQLLLADFVSSSGCRVSIQYRHIQSPHRLTWRGTHSYSCYWLTLCHRQGVVFPFSVDIYNHRTCERVWRYGIYKYPVDLERNAQLQLLLADFVSLSGCRVSIQCRHIQSPHM
ncbi:hypothetical protein PAMA_022046 [Pampus argenteus]